jgi:AAA15 family ATPase/GTPase
MANNLVRIINFEIKNFKNVENGAVKFCNSRAVENTGKLEKTDIMAVYGQNGSGKTALVEAFDVLKKVMHGDSLPKDKYHLFHAETPTEMRFEFVVNKDGTVYKVGYNFVIEHKEDNLAYISEEQIEVRQFLGDDKKKWTKVKKIYTSQHIEEILSIPNGSIPQDGLIDLLVAKRYAKKAGTSFLFSDDCVEVLNKYQYDYVDLDLFMLLKQFAEINLFVVTVEQLGLVNLSNLIPIYFRVEDQIGISSGGIPINLFDESVVPDHYYDLIENIKDQINIVLNAIIPGLQIDVESNGQGKTEDGILGQRIQFVALRYGKKFALKYESEGIKRIISILSTLIAVYSKRNVCLIVDEFDSGVFEYLLGQILELLNSCAEGQFIFTSHNLRALEVLPKEKIVFSTANPKNRYLAIKGVGTNNNLRDFYLRTVLLGGQDEVVYEDTNMIDLKRAFRKAGRASYGN